jgi:FkbM family methyltransferase
MAESFRSPAKVARRLKLLPEVARHVKNWPSFMWHYALGLVPEKPYRFRNGARLKIGRGVDHVPVIEIFFREDYGAMPSDAVIVDLGASVGVFSVYAAATSRNSRIYAYEPMPDSYRLAQENVRINGQEQAIRCFNHAVGGEAGARDLYVAGTDFFFPTLLGPDDTGGNAQAEHISVHCTTLAEIIEANGLDRIDMLKMDIEGAEYEFLYGAPARCFERIGEIRMEYHDLDGERRNVDSLKRFLEERGFQVTHEQAVSATNGNLWARREG